MKSWPKTQKARGLIYLRTSGLHGQRWMAQVPGAFVIIPSLSAGQEDDMEMFPPHQPSLINFPTFARPCPTTPRHGFVESRLVQNVEGALDVLAETLRADPEGEVIFMPRCTGEYSAVANNAGIVWGHGSAGVTGGGDKPVAFIPCLVEPERWTQAVCHLFDVGIKQCAYVELVENNGCVQMVQLRDGPPQTSAGKDFIPRRVTVKGVVFPQDVNFDLMQWDRLIRAARRGTVAVLSPNSTRFSHFAVHCLINKVPVVFGTQPELGSTLTPSAASPVTRLTQEHYEYIARIIMRRLLLREPIREHDWGDETQANNPLTWQVATAIGVCHAMVGWGAEAHLLRLRGEGVAACFRYSATACIGEVRHFYANGPGSGASPRKDKPATNMESVLSADIYEQFSLKQQISRDETYTSISHLPLSVQIELVTQTQRDFKSHGWGQSFGGSSWAEAARQTAWLGRSIIAFCKKPNAERWLRLQCRYNATLHACHNNGKVLTKWISGSALTVGAVTPALCFMNPFAANSALREPKHLLLLTPLQQTFEEKELNHGK